MALALLRYFARRTLGRIARQFRPQQELEEKDDDSCSICLEQVDDPACLPCLHVFCHSCVNQLTKKREKSPGEILAQQILRVTILTCPSCRMVIYKKSDRTLRFPTPKSCEACNSVLRRAYKFPQCSHTAGRFCVSCLERHESEGTVRCPECLAYCDRGSLEEVFLCSTCEKFSTERVCSPCMRGMLGFPQNTEERRSEAGTSAGAIVLFSLLLLMALWGLEKLEPAPEYTQGVAPKSVLRNWQMKANVDVPKRNKNPGSNTFINNYKKRAWYVDVDGRVYVEDRFFKEIYDQRGKADRIHPPGDVAQNEIKNSGSRQKAKAIEKEESKTKRKRIAVYRTECNPARAWEVSPEGEVYTKKCEKVIVGYRES